MLKLVMMLLLQSSVRCDSEPQGLAPPAMTRLPVGTIEPKGWLLEQLKLQAEGLSGHLSQFWDDVLSSIWIGGKADGGLHERLPYWLNGFVPLAYLLRAANVTELPGATGLYVQRVACATVEPTRRAADCRDLSFVRPLDQVRNYIEYILRFQRSANGWIGPSRVEDSNFVGDMYWPATDVLQALTQYAEAEPQEFSAIAVVVCDHLLQMRRLLRSTALLAPNSSGHSHEPAGAVAYSRWIDVIASVVWVLDSGVVPEHEFELLDLFRTLRAQGKDWDAVFAAGSSRLSGQHNVNIAQALKSAAVEYRFSPAAQAKEASRVSLARMQALDDAYGLPTGMFVGDELLPLGPSHDPSRGIELCGVVEAMYSYEVMFAIHGDVPFADRLERIAYNALPATWASPRGGDMWSHQYFQSVNQIRAVNGTPFYWPQNGTGPDAAAAESYGLSPNYGCCTANFNQGWPKFASSLFYTTSDGGIAVGLWAPASAATRFGNIDVNTSYPFSDEATVTVIARQRLPLYLRIPGWATGATVNGHIAENGTMHMAICVPGKNLYRILFGPTVRLERTERSKQQAASYSIHRGALMYSLPLEANFTLSHHYMYEANDYNVHLVGPWAFALDADPAHPSKSLPHVAERMPNHTYSPFNRTRVSNRILATVRSVSHWAEVNGSAAPPPASPVCTHSMRSCGVPENVTFIPHGGTVLRMGMLPLSGFGMDSGRTLVYV